MSNDRNNNTNVSAGGIGFGGVLAIVFIVLKLVGVINWSWWLVLSPIWISWVIGLVALLIVFIVILIEDNK